MTTRTGWIGLAAALGLLAGCGGSEPPAAPATSSKTVETAEPVVDPAVAEATKRTTGAMTVGRATAPVEVRFALDAAPTVGQPLGVELALVTQVPVPTVQIEVKGEPDVRILEPLATVQLEKVQAGTLQTVRVQAVPTKEGTSTITVAVQLDQPTGSESRNFQLPLVVGSDAAPGAPAAGAATGDATAPRAAPPG